ncbi:MAG: hypothetical protein CMA30_08900 [Euryarchaeota archaeon]|nr:hypothetical protein [Euryarchaeota archaeon]|tara:strand:- start:1987 stop:2520 length:534 start_codon:yes stop_codon:yes gene_type:complete
MTKEASLEPLNDKEVEDFLARQRRAQEDSEWKTSTGIKETIAKAERLQKKIAKQKAAAKRKPRKLPFGEAWSNRFREQLLGRTITAVKYLNKEECGHWDDSTLALRLSIGSTPNPYKDIWAIASQDDEQNQSGVMTFCTVVPPDKYKGGHLEELAPNIPKHELGKTDHWMNEEKKKK